MVALKILSLASVFSSISTLGQFVNQNKKDDLFKVVNDLVGEISNINKKFETLSNMEQQLKKVVSTVSTIESLKLQLQEVKQRLDQCERLTSINTDNPYSEAAGRTFILVRNFE